MLIDLRSDTVTRPTEAMREAMARAEVGDDVFGDDSTILALESHFADMAGKPAALLVSSGTMGNQLCLASLARRGTEVICESRSHIFSSEAGAAATLWGLTIRPIQAERGIFSSADLKSAWRDPANIHNAPSSVVVIENTHNAGGGTIWPLESVREIVATARSLGLAAHLDGARLWNAIAATGIPFQEWAEPFDTVTACFSKGLGAPVGSMIAGSEPVIAAARRYRKMIGGGMRQAGILAAAADFALTHHLPLLEEDHEKCRRLAVLLSASPRLRVRNDPPESNILFVDPVHPETMKAVAGKCADAGVLFHAMGGGFRFVTHRDVSMGQIEEAAQKIIAACEAV